MPQAYTYDTRSIVAPAASCSAASCGEVLSWRGFLVLVVAYLVVLRAAGLLIGVDVERAAELASAISELPSGQRDAVVLFHLADLPQEVVATGVGASGPDCTRHAPRCASA
jgi:hypothetical protein